MPTSSVVMGITARGVFLFVSAIRGSTVKGNNIILSLLLHLVVLLLVLRPSSGWLWWNGGGGGRHNNRNIICVGIAHNWHDRMKGQCYVRVTNIICTVST